MYIPSVTVEQMTEVDRLMMKEFNIVLAQMMENAGRLLANSAIEIFKPQSVTILVGPGNNGADGIVAARYLHNKGIEVEVVLSLEQGDLSDIAVHHLDALKMINVPVGNNIGKKPDLFIDCLLGYNTKGAPYGKIAEIIAHAKELGVPVLSCDVPSGFELSTKQWHSPGFENATCITLGLPKKGMMNNPKIPRIYVGDLGIPPGVYKKIGIEIPVLFAEKDFIEIKNNGNIDYSDEPGERVQEPIHESTTEQPTSPESQPQTEHSEVSRPEHSEYHNI